MSNQLHNYKNKYLKYKKKYMILKKILGGMIPSPIMIPSYPKVQLIDLYIQLHKIIKIDDYYFKFICKIKSPCKNDRIQYLVLSSLTPNFEKYKELIFYRSISQLDFLRLAYREDCQEYNKGTFDYIQQTFIHMDLQMFIYNNEKNEDYFNILHSDYNRIISQYMLLENINDIERKISNLEPFNYIKNGTGDGISNCGNPGDNNVINCELKRLTKLINDSYNIDSIKKIFDYEDYDKLKIETYEMILSHRENKNIKIKQYFIKYDINKFNNTKIVPPIKNKTAPLFLTTYDSKITDCGVYSNYIISGNYICKIFDYKNQCIDDGTSHCFNDETYVFIGDRYDGIFDI